MELSTAALAVLNVLDLPIGSGSKWGLAGTGIALGALSVYAGLPRSGNCSRDCTSGGPVIVPGAMIVGVVSIGTGIFAMVREAASAPMWRHDDAPGWWRVPPARWPEPNATSPRGTPVVRSATTAEAAPRILERR